MTIDWVNTISNVGFPIAIALYVLLRLEATLKRNTEVIQELINNLGRRN